MGGCGNGFPIGARGKHPTGGCGSGFPIGGRQGGTHKLLIGEFANGLNENARTFILTSNGRCFDSLVLKSYRSGSNSSCAAEKQ